MVTQYTSFLPPNVALQCTPTELACLLTLADLAEDQAVLRADQVASAHELQGLQRLYKRNLVTITGDGTLSLTTNGCLLAHHLQIRHRLLERFLCDALGVPWIFVHREAMCLASSASPHFFERVVELTRHATVCPHGNPIPGRSAPLVNEQRLATAPFGQRCRLVRIAEWVSHAPHRLQRLWSHEVLPGCTLIRVPDPLHRYVVRLNQRSLVLGQRMAEALFVVVE
ncbi:metal-dependent transcriptional regulator [uncultured Chloroflexus sp.]|uniref:metal-dependent transcriptional regulator n=1 Tax=uncultured Chloroflexus sp. TaxID=214040 RepID=UPI0026181903|nr:metal-dependent transcriptional regulator [uncultured Chloroflexus sp.]